MESRDEIFSKIACHWWKVMNGAGTVSMGENGGILVYQFEQDGSLSFPSEISFLPSERLWHWDENQQIIELLNEHGDLREQLLPPFWDGNYYILKSLSDADTTYRCEPYIENIIQLKWAPDPILQSSGLSLTKAIPVCLKSQIENSEISNALGEDQIETISIINEYSSFDFWRISYDLIIDHFFWSNIAVLSPQFEQSTLLNSNTTNSKLQIYINIRSEIVGILGSRSLLTELIGESILQYRLYVYSSKTCSIQSVIMSVLNQNFNDRMTIIKL